jgi:hypothetical protein
VVALDLVPVKDLVLGGAGEIGLDGGRAFSFTDGCKDPTNCPHVRQGHVFLQVLAHLVVDEETGVVEQLGLTFLRQLEFEHGLCWAAEVVVDGDAVLEGFCLVEDSPELFVSFMSDYDVEFADDAA